MRFILDMVHHNPGEAPHVTAFTNPRHLASYGFNGQVFKHLNCVATFAATGVDVFPAGTPERDWLNEKTLLIDQEIAAAKAVGLSVFYHIDLFVLPRRLVEHYRGEMCDPATGHIRLDRPRTLILHEIMFEELASRFPAVDGFVIRVGETYLFDTPYHVGNGAVPHFGPPWSADYLYSDVLKGKEIKPNWADAQADSYTALIQFLRDSVCVKLNKYILFRTWDIFPDKLHACAEHYLQVTDRVAPHLKLLFSIKHTALDFWRHVRVNECLGQGKHAQIIEVQCQREYEGKGAFPNYVMGIIINGFEENATPLGLRQLLLMPQVQGIYSWSRGGGWSGPKIPNELWPDLNAYVLASFVSDRTQDERGLVRKYAIQRLGLSEYDSELFHELCVLSARAVLKGRYCAAFDSALGGKLLPTANWMRDDRLGGRHQLRPVLEYLVAKGKLQDALAEKMEAVDLFRRIGDIADIIAWPEPALGEFVRTSAAYGRILFSIILEGWKVMAFGVTGEKTGEWNLPQMRSAVERYRALWQEYATLTSGPLSSTPFRGCYLFREGESRIEGLDETVNYFLDLASRSS